MQWSPVSYQLNAMCSCSFLWEDSSNDSHTKAKKFIFNLKTLSRRGVLKIDKEGKANAIVKQWAAGVIHCVLQESRSPAALSWGPFVCLKTLKFRFWTLDESQMMRTFSPKFSSEVWFRTTCGFSLPVFMKSASSFTSKTTISSGIAYEHTRIKDKNRKILIISRWEAGWLQWIYSSLKNHWMITILEPSRWTADDRRQKNTMEDPVSVH